MQVPGYLGGRQRMHVPPAGLKILAPGRQIGNRPQSAIQFVFGTREQICIDLVVSLQVREEGRTAAGPELVQSFSKGRAAPGLDIQGDAGQVERGDDRPQEVFRQDEAVVEAFHHAQHRDLPNALSPPASDLAAGEERRNLRRWPTGRCARYRAAFCITTGETRRGETPLGFASLGVVPTGDTAALTGALRLTLRRPRIVEQIWGVSGAREETRRSRAIRRPSTP